MAKLMKKLYILLIILSANFAIAQQASDYFPANTGFKWNYRQTPLDSANNPVLDETFFRIDSFTVVSDFNGKTADIVLTKQGGENIIGLLPFTDSLFFNFSGSEGFEYFRVRSLDSVLIELDSTLADSMFSFLNFFTSLEGWYSTYRFAENVGQSYTLISVDTTVNFNSTEIPLRFEFIGTRLNDETLETEIGTFDCKKFLIERKISYLILLPPPLPPVVIPRLVLEDTIWAAPGNWIVKSFIPSTTMDLTIIGGNIFTIPGLETDIIANITAVDDQITVPGKFVLAQNYPNPFNPSTNIKFQLPSAGFVSLKIFNQLGMEIANLYSGELNPGNHIISFNGKNLASGVYFYRLKFKNKILTKKMLLLK